MLWLSVHSPFAAFRSFTVGSFRQTAPFITPSAAYGLVLNLAGIEMRQDDAASPMSLIGRELPKLEIALGALGGTEQQCLFQQAHSYRVGESGKVDNPENPGEKITIGEEGFRRGKGNKYSITPIRRAFLSDLRACIGLRGNDHLEEKVREGLAGRGLARYGLPFLGDNNFLPDRIDPLSATLPARWWIPVLESESSDDGPQADIARLSITIDRQDISCSKSQLFRLMAQVTDEVPEAAWVKVEY